MAKILLKFKDSVLKDFPLDKKVITIGRKPTNDIHIDNPAVSGFHAKIVEEGGRFSIEDLNSLNGTFVKGEKINNVLLNEGDDIIIGKHTLSFISETNESDVIKIPRKSRPLDGTIKLDKNVQQKILGKTSEVVGGLIVTKGSLDKKEYELTDRVASIGKDKSARIRLKGVFAPRVAALVHRSKEGYFINASGSKNVLKINGKKLKERYALEDGDIVQVEDVEMEFYLK